MLNYQTLNHNQVFSLCAVNPFGWRNNGSEKLNALVTQILAAVATHKAGQEQTLVDTLKTLIEKYSNVSIGTALDTLHSAATTGKELDGDHDGLDALCYHLSGDSCVKGISALTKVLRRFDEMAKEDEAKRRQAVTK